MLFILYLFLFVKGTSQKIKLVNGHKNVKDLLVKVQKLLASRKEQVKEFNEPMSQICSQQGSKGEQKGMIKSAKRLIQQQKILAKFVKIHKMIDEKISKYEPRK